jgi:hypothetical protein
VELYQTKGVGITPEVVARSRQAPFWSALEAIAHTLVHGSLILAPLSPLETLFPEPGCSPAFGLYPQVGAVLTAAHLVPPVVLLGRCACLGTTGPFGPGGANRSPRVLRHTRRGEHAWAGAPRGGHRPTNMWVSDGT